MRRVRSPVLPQRRGVGTWAAEMEPLAQVAPSWGWRRPLAGRAAHVEPGALFQATSVQACGLFPFVQGSGVPPYGVPVGRHMLSAETVSLEPIAWLRAGLVTNPGVFVLGQPGVGKSTITTRLLTGSAAFGMPAFVPGEPKGEYSALVAHLGGQVVRVGRGLDRINPLDAGPLGRLARRLSGAGAAQLNAEVRGRRLALLSALCGLVRRTPITDGEEVALARAVDLLAARLDVDPTVPDVLRVLEEGPDELMSAMYADERTDYRRQVTPVCWTLRRLCEGSLGGLFDGPSDVTLDLDRPASVDISAVTSQGDTAVAAAMFCSWAWGFALLDAAAVVGGVRRQRLIVLDEMWRALRAAPGLVEHADQLTRLNRHTGAATVMVTHTLADLEALATEEDRAKARGFVERCGITILGALPAQELDRVARVTPMTSAERELVSSWAAPPSWTPTAAHPGRGEYLVKTGARLGIPVDLRLVEAERALYDTDQAVRA